MRKITTYERLTRHVQSWVDGDTERLLVVGPPGVGKSTIYEQIIAKAQTDNRKRFLGPDPPVEPMYHQLTGRLSPIECFRLLRDEPRSLIVFDDLLGILGDQHFISLLMQLCETRPFRAISWKTNAPTLHGEEKMFLCYSRVLIVLNHVPSKKSALNAILDRMDGVRFEPTKSEILAKMRQIWPEEHELIDLMANTKTTPTLRTMHKALEWKKSPHLDVIEELYSECGVPKPIQVLCDVMRNEPKDKWFKCYQEVTKRGERSFRRHKRIAENLISAWNGNEPLGLGDQVSGSQSPAEMTDVGRTGGGTGHAPEGGNEPPFDGR